MKSAIIRTGFDTLYFSGAHLLLRPFFEGVGAIVMLHHVRPPRRDEFQPNRLLDFSIGKFSDRHQGVLNAVDREAHGMREFWIQQQEFRYPQRTNLSRVGLAVRLESRARFQ